MECRPFLREKFEYMNTLPAKEQVKELLNLSPENRGIYSRFYHKERNLREGLEYIGEMAANIPDQHELNISLGINIPGIDVDTPPNRWEPREPRYEYMGHRVVVL